MITYSSIIEKVSLLFTAVIMLQVNKPIYFI